MVSDYGGMLFEPISDEIVQWIFKQVKFTELFRVCYLDARENGNNPLLDKLKNIHNNHSNEVYIIN